MVQSVGSKGFTLIETLIAIAIFSIVLLGLIAGMVLSYKTSLSNVMRNEAINILHEKMEDIRDMDYADITDTLNNGAVNCEDALDNGKNYVERQVGNVNRRFGIFFAINEDTDVQVKEIRIDVCWRLEGNLKNVSGTTIVRNKS